MAASIAPRVPVARIATTVMSEPSAPSRRVRPVPMHSGGKMQPEGGGQHRAPDDGLPPPAVAIGHAREAHEVDVEVHTDRVPDL
jgi:hypothetical protein